MALYDTTTIPMVHYHNTTTIPMVHNNTTTIPMVHYHNTTPIPMVHYHNTTTIPMARRLWALYYPRTTIIILTAPVESVIYHNIPKVHFNTPTDDQLQ